MRSLDLPVQLWRASLDVDVFHAQVGDMPVEERLELVAAVGSNGSNAERELLDHIVDEVDRIGLGVALVAFSMREPASHRRSPCTDSAGPADLFFSLGSGT